MTDFVGFKKITRLSREMIVSEKIDGTNGQIFIGEDGEFLVGKRSGWITPDNDNYGFAAWAYDNRNKLITGLGPGRHYGEWWGHGINRGYGLPKGDRRFSLFNVNRWYSAINRPACCYVVPIINVSQFDMMTVRHCLDYLVTNGSLAAPGYMKPEGVVVMHKPSGYLFKKTIEKDEGKNEK
jgi:hypothetical protein